MELVIVIVVTLLAAGLGGWVGYYLAKNQSNRVRTVDLSLELFSGDFSTVRANFLKEIRALDEGQIKILGERDDERYDDLRQAAFDIFNKYDLICYLKNQGDLDQTIFNKYILEIIESDYTATDHLFAAIENDYKKRGISDCRPFFPEVAKVAPRV